MNPHKMAVMLSFTKWELLTQIDELLLQLYPEEIDLEEISLALEEDE